MSDECPSRRGRAVLVMALVCYFLSILAINLAFAPYPEDNDLDEIGWMAAHQSLSRPESLVNQVLPLGYPLVLRLLTPVFGSLLTAALVCSTVGATAAVYLVFLLTRRLGSRAGTAAAAAATAGFMLLPMATSEFCDILTTALILAGIYAVVARPASSAATLCFGASAGLCFLFRFHYLSFLVIGPIGLLVGKGSTRDRLRAITGFLAGFVIGALPLLVINTVVHGQPLHTGYTRFSLGQFAVAHLGGKQFDFDDFLGTYDLWPMSRVLSEHPLALVRFILSNLRTLLHLPEIGAGIVLIPLTVLWALRPELRRSGMFIATIVVLYIGAVMLPSRFTERAFAPVTCLLCVLSFPALARLSESLPAGFRVGGRPVVPTAWVTAAVIVLFIGTGNPMFRLGEKRKLLHWNQGVLDTMRGQGWQPDDKVFCNFWNFYNLDDPRFLTFHNYGGWLLLDSEYNATMPRPDAHSAAEWQAFLDRHGIRFLIAEPKPSIDDFLAHRDLQAWLEIHRDARIVVLKRTM